MYKYKLLIKQLVMQSMVEWHRYMVPLVLIFKTIRPSSKTNKHAQFEVDISNHF